MNVIISDDIRNDHQLFDVVQGASKSFNQLTFGSGIPMTAEWKLERDTKRQLLIHLSLTDATGAQADARFPAEELAKDRWLKARLYKVWGDLLQSRSHKQLDLLSGRIQAGE